MHLFNDTDHPNQFKKTEWGVSGSEGEREREEQIKGVRDESI
jgi:hypothetical protein